MDLESCVPIFRIVSFLIAGNTTENRRETQFQIRKNDSKRSQIDRSCYSSCCPGIVLFYKSTTVLSREKTRLYGEKYGDFEQMFKLNTARRTFCIL